MKSETVSIPVAAARLGISSKTAYSLVKSEKFPVRVLRIGSRTRIATADLDRFLASVRPSEMETQNERRG